MSLKVKFLKALGLIKIYKGAMFIVFKPDTYQIKGKHYQHVANIIKPGDILLRGYTNYLDGFFIPGKYSHAALYIGGIDETIIHAKTPCVQETDLCTFMRCDRLALIRPMVSDKDKSIAIEKIQSKLGVPYDYNFDFEETDNNGRNFSCSELVYYAYENNHTELNWKLEDFRFMFITKKIFAPSSLLPTNENSAILWEK